MQRFSSFFTRPGVLIGILAVLLLLGGLFRFDHLSAQPYWMDEGYTINAVLSIEQKGVSVLDSGVTYSCLLYCYPTAWIAEAHGNTATDYRLLAAVAGIIFIAITFFVVKDLFTTPIALLSSFFVTFSYWQIAWSRQARWYTLFELFFWLATLFFYRFLYKEKQKLLSITLTIFFIILSCLTHSLGYLLPFLFVLWYCIDSLWIQKRFSLKKFLLILGSSIVALILLAIIFKSNTLISLLRGIQFHYELPYYLSFYLRTYWLFILFSIVALYSVTGRAATARYFLMFLFIGYLIPLSFLSNIVQYRYLFQVTPVLLILGAVGIYDVYLLLMTSWQRLLYCIAIIIVFFTIAGGVLIPKSFYALESDSPASIGHHPSVVYTPQPDWNSAYAFIKSHLVSSNIVITSMPQFDKIFLGIPGYWLQYDYLGTPSSNGLAPDGNDLYVNAPVIHNASQLQALTATHHGYLVIDYMALDGKLNSAIAAYITTHFTQVFYEKTNVYSQIWVYQF